MTRIVLAETIRILYMIEGLNSIQMEAKEIGTVRMMMTNKKLRPQFYQPMRPGILMNFGEDVFVIFN